MNLSTSNSVLITSRNKEIALAYSLNNESLSDISNSHHIIIISDKWVATSPD